MPPPILYFHCTVPENASKAYRKPSPLPTMTVSPTIVGLEMNDCPVRPELKVQRTVPFVGCKQ